MKILEITNEGSVIDFGSFKKNKEDERTGLAHMNKVLDTFESEYPFRFVISNRNQFNTRAQAYNSTVTPGMPDIKSFFRSFRFEDAGEVLDENGDMAERFVLTKSIKYDGVARLETYEYKDPEFQGFSSHADVIGCKTKELYDQLGRFFKITGYLK